MPATEGQISEGRETQGPYRTIVLEKDSSRQSHTLHGRHVSIAVRRQRGLAILGRYCDMRKFQSRQCLRGYDGSAELYSSFASRGSGQLRRFILDMAMLFAWGISNCVWARCLQDSEKRCWSWQHFFAAVKHRNSGGAFGQVAALPFRLRANFLINTDTQGSNFAPNNLFILYARPVRAS